MDHSENTLRAVIHSLTDAVAPAVDPKDPLANEQLKLCVEYLEFLRSRLDDVHGRARFEARHALLLAHEITEDASVVDEGLATALSTADRQVRAALEDPEIRTVALTGATRRLDAVTREVIRACAGAGDDVRSRIERAILRISEERIEFDRAWYQPFGFDPLPTTIRGLEGLLYPEGAVHTGPE